MPRYFFDVVEGDLKNLVRDSEGVVFAGVHEARKEAVDYARDVVRHGFCQSTQTWKVVVTDENGTQVLTLPLSEMRARKGWVWWQLRRRLARFESSFGPRTFALLAGAAVIGIVVHAMARREVATKESRGYQTASVQTGGTIVAVRFAPQASVADITKFLEAYNASLIGDPRGAGFYRLLIGKSTMPQKDLAKLVGRMAQEKVVEFAAAVQ
jgi:hypothetical protein